MALPGHIWGQPFIGGWQPRRRRDGKELFYLTPYGTADVKAASRFEKGIPKALFATQVLPPQVGASARGFQYDVTPDGRRFLGITPLSVEDVVSTRITLVLNWTSGLKR